MRAAQLAEARRTPGAPNRVSVALMHVWRGRSCLLALLVCGCAQLPPHRYGVNDLEVEGMKEMDERALKACLATKERDKIKLGFGSIRDAECNEPPFDDARAGLSLFAWPWTEWPAYDEAVLKLDLERIQRWYEARGFYDATILRAELDPQQAEDSDEANCSDPPCTVDITLKVREGRAVLVRSLKLQIDGNIPDKLRAALAEAIELEPGERFDEAEYDQAKQAVLRALREAGYARAKVSGDVAVHRGLLWADLTLKVEPGRQCKIGKVRIESSSEVPRGPVVAAAKLRKGRPYRESDLDDAQRAIYALGAFSAVSVRGDLSGNSEWVDIDIELEPRRKSEWQLGAGVMSGLLTTGPAAAEWTSVPQWDVHLLGRYEHRNFFGKLRHFEIEERPRLLFLDAFPKVPDNSPRFGNALDAKFSQPGVIERRTRLIAETRWEYGPDPFLLFFRHDFGVAIGLERAFARERRLTIRVALHQDIMEVSPRQPIVTDNEIPSSYRLPFVEQRIALDLRDDSVQPTKGAYLATSLHEAVRLWEPSWNYLRLTPEARGYVPVGLGMVVAARFALGMLYILSASPGLDETSERLGPQVYRLRGGGAQSNRGFAPGLLGDGVLGGIRRWESSLELRVPLNSSFSLAVFGDMGDVHAGKGFRFTHLNTSLGAGLRYRTVIGPIRLDVGYRPDALQRARGATPSDAPQTNLGLARFDGAIHLTIGESF
jgi:translocation and assembly module TamA